MYPFDDPFPTRLAWRHTTGIAQHDDIHAKLRQAPAIEGMECMTELEFVPDVVAEVRIGCERTRPMEPIERLRAMAVLLRMSTGARDALNGDTTIVVVQR